MGYSGSKEVRLIGNKMNFSQTADATQKNSANKTDPSPNTSGYGCGSDWGCIAAAASIVSIVFNR